MFLANYYFFGGIMEFFKLGYFKPTHFIMMLFIPIIFCSIYFLLKNKKSKTIKISLLVICGVNAAIYISYKLVMAFTFEEFVILNELPLHLCNLNLILMPLTICIKNQKFRDFFFGYFFFVGGIAALCGILFYDSVFTGRSTLSYAVLIYFIYHSTLFVLPYIFVGLGLYKPKINDAWKAMVVLVSLAFVMHILNLILRATGACSISNYFYTMGMPENPVLGLLQKLIPIPFLYMLPIVPILYGIDVLIALPFYYKEKRQKEKVLNL